ncbi:hypothetical protein M409DRAFT_17086 [Zasmidium cellare ATCC 36951]|uniref:2Fe-2S ferredoxin-type domain-containing protein n=1 Tax=Zasmidium cellare ATCC 36951 TaxID=1080233 RepID=A0A6A6D4T7_ZASCE|nr:uncharacterized protein M409DRAFT_17086 [Zasmidium cellare ATCC 36951]KAF2173139.1 hypothetical protein M409DRAFT_17086 [Zasmidium cellare ATCC 36951]
MSTTPDIEDALVTFTLSRKTVRWHATSNLSILELAEQAGLKPDYGCRSAMCGTCEVYGPEGDGPQGIFICRSKPATREVEIEL